MCRRSRHGLAVWLALSLSASGWTSADASQIGTKWFQYPPTYQVFAHAQINGVLDFNGSVLPALREGFAAWTKAQVTCTSWDVTFGGTFSSPSGIGALGVDGQNRVLWLGGAFWQHGSALAITTTTYRSSTGEIVDADLEFNDNVSWSTTGASSAYDLRTVATHEAGHFLGLGHTEGARSAVMYPTRQPGEIVHALAEADLTDVCQSYPKNPTGAQGRPCQQDTDCATGLVCRGPPGSTSRLCTVDCTSGASCPTGYSCQDSTPGKACLVSGGLADLCRFCTTGAQCSTGTCVTDGRHFWCSKTCQDDGACGAGYRCSPAGSSKYCVPSARCSGQCGSPSDCPAGFTCDAGECEATGQPGDRCELTAYCDSCSVCVGTAVAASCTPCCAGASDAGVCAGCPALTCDGGTCTALTGTGGSVCLPPGRGPCEPCDGTNGCATGLECLAGRCHSTCSPGHPGACPACFAGGGGKSFCACEGEVALAGEPCGLSATAIKACQGELVCATDSLTQRCRRRCAPDAGGGGCQSSESCTTVEGVSFCLPKVLPGSPCNACDGTRCQPGLVCVEGKCHQPCNASAPACAACLAVTTTVAVCGCESERAPLNQACGVVAGVGVVPCQFGLRCHAGVCRAECNPQGSSCAAGTQCVVTEGAGLCLPPSPAPSGDGGGGAIPSAPPDAGAAGPRITDGGCGCASSSPGVPSLVVVLLLWLGLALARFGERRGRASGGGSLG